MERLPSFSVPASSEAATNARWRSSDTRRAAASPSSSTGRRPGASPSCCCSTPARTGRKRANAPGACGWSSWRGPRGWAPPAVAGADAGRAEPRRRLPDGGHSGDDRALHARYSRRPAGRPDDPAGAHAASGNDRLPNPRRHPGPRAAGRAPSSTARWRRTSVDPNWKSSGPPPDAARRGARRPNPQPAWFPLALAGRAGAHLRTDCMSRRSW